MTAGTELTVNIAKAVDIQAVTDPDEVEEGSSVKAVFVEMWLRGQDTSPGSVLATVYKTASGQVAMTFAQQIALHDYDNKKNILYHTQGLTNINTSQAVPFIRQWFKIPKGKQRMGLGDTLRLSISAQALDTNACGFFTYKEYT